MGIEQIGYLSTFLPSGGYIHYTINRKNMDRIKYFTWSCYLHYAEPWRAGTMESPEALKLAQVMDKVSRFYVDSIDDSEVVENTIDHMLA